MHDGGAGLTFRDPAQAGQEPLGQRPEGRAARAPQQYGQPLRLTTINAQGINGLGKREAIERYLQNHNIDIAAISETRHNTTHKKNTNGGSSEQHSSEIR